MGKPRGLAMRAFFMVMAIVVAGMVVSDATHEGSMAAAHQGQEESMATEEHVEATTPKEEKLLAANWLLVREINRLKLGNAGLIVQLSAASKKMDAKIQLTALASKPSESKTPASDLPFNYSHPVKAPESDGLPLTKDTWQKVNGKWSQDKVSCKTQITVTDYKGKKFRNEKTCTSCDPNGKTGYGATLEMKWGLAKAGQCHSFYSSVLVRCTSLDRNEERASPNATNVFCSKTGLLIDQVKLGSVSSKAARLFFRPLTSKSKVENWAVARCNMIKHTACRGRQCAVKKSVTCASVCVFTGWNAAKAMPNFKDCDKKYCKGKMGKLACTEIARMA